MPKLTAMARKAITAYQPTPKDQLRVAREMAAIKTMFAVVWADGFEKGFRAGRRSKR